MKIGNDNESTMTQRFL
jgi:hypothetical protein